MPRVQGHKKLQTFFQTHVVPSVQYRVFSAPIPFSFLSFDYYRPPYPLSPFFSFLIILFLGGGGALNVAVHATTTNWFTRLENCVCVSPRPSLSFCSVGKCLKRKKGEKSIITQCSVSLVVFAVYVPPTLLLILLFGLITPIFLKLLSLFTLALRGHLFGEGTSENKQNNSILMRVVMCCAPFERKKN